MAHFAQLDNDNKVVQVIAVNNDALGNMDFPASDAEGASFCRSLFGADTTWVQTSFSGAFRKNYAGVGYVYDGTRDAFIPPRPYPSWVLDETTCLWATPIPYPEDGNLYSWDETTMSWVISDQGQQVPDYEVT